MKYFLKLTALFLMGFVFTEAAFAVGTSAGSNITNTATANYTVSGLGNVANSNTTTTTVDEILDVTAVWQDAANVIVNSGDVNQVLTYLIANTGNGTDNYTLSVNNAIAGDQFDPVFVDIYFDTNGNGNYDAGTDIQYIVGVNNPVLAADTSITVFVLNNIPAALSNGDLGDSQFTATSNTGTGVPGTTIVGAGDGGTDAVVGSSGATANDTGTYVVTGTLVAIVKSVNIADPFGGSQPVPGAVMTYTLVVTVTGTGTATAVTITDPIPTDTTYNANSMTLNTVAQTDASDSPTDESDYNITNAGSITIILGDLTSASPTQTITFDVTIN